MKTSLSMKTAFIGHNSSSNFSLWVSKPKSMGLLINFQRGVPSELWTYGIGGRDATILALMRKHGVGEIFTHDRGFKQLARRGVVKVIDPIK